MSYIAHQRRLNLARTVHPGPRIPRIHLKSDMKSRYQSIGVFYQARGNFRYGSNLEVRTGNRKVRFTPSTGHCRQDRPCPKSAKPGSRRCNHQDDAPKAKATRMPLFNSTLMIGRRAIIIDRFRGPLNTRSHSRRAATLFRRLTDSYDGKCHPSRNRGRTKRNTTPIQERRPIVLPWSFDPCEQPLGCGASCVNHEAGVTSALDHSRRFQHVRVMSG
jgi:hypothetical protein